MDNDEMALGKSDLMRVKYVTFDSITSVWTAANEAQAEGRFSRDEFMRRWCEPTIPDITLTKADYRIE